MTVFYNLADLSAGLKELLRRVDILETTDWGGFSSVDEGAFRILSEEGLIVVGSARIDGELVGVNGSQLDWDGDVKIKRTLDVTAATKLQGTLDVTGLTKLNATVQLLKDLQVKAGGKITVEGPVAATLENGKLSFASGGELTSYTGGATLRATGVSSSLSVGTGSTALIFSGNQVNISVDGTYVTGALATSSTLTLGSLPTTTSAANVFATTSGTLQKVSSAARFKIDPRPMFVPDELLDVPVQEWVDLGSAETFAGLYLAPRPFTREQQAAFDGIDLKRVPGVIAEDVEAAGGEAFVTRDPDGRIEGVAYDRLALARTEILSRKFDAAMELIADLQRQLAE